MPAKVLVIGLDAADKELLLRWSDSGDLPVLQSLRRKGTWGLLTSPPGLGDDSTWASFHTCVSPARHGRFFTHQMWPGSYKIVRFKDKQLKGELFWERFSQAHKKVALIDVPKCPLPRVLNGIHLVDWLVHGSAHPQPSSWPPSLASEVVARFGPTPNRLCSYDHLPQEKYQNFLENMMAGIEMKSTMANHYLGRENWDLFLAVFKESHCTGHHLWHLQDSTHHQYVETSTRNLKSPIKLVYQAIDAAIGRLLEQVEPNTHVIVFSHLGMGPNYTANHLLDEILRRLEGFRTTSARKGLGMLNAGWKHLPVGVRNFLSRRVKLINPAKTVLSQTEAALPKYFSVPHNEISGAIRINLIGREASGRVRPGKEYDDLCRFLTRRLLELVNPETGRSLVQTVLQTAFLYQGEYLANLPDLLVVWNREAFISTAWSAKVGKVIVPVPNFRSGNHVPDGIFFARGPNVSSGTQCPTASIMDLASTIGSILDVPFPEVDGIPIPEISGTKCFPKVVCLVPRR